MTILIISVVFIFIWICVYASTQNRRSILNTPLTKVSKKENSTPEFIGGVRLFIIALPALGVSFYISAQILLCYLYGVGRVFKEGLHFIAMPKGRPWIVSNGDLVSEDVKPLHFVIGVVLWLLLTISIVLLTYWLFPGKKASASNNGVSAEKANVG